MSAGVRIGSLGPVATGSLVASSGGIARVTVIVKATFALLADRAAEIAAPVDVATEDVRGPRREVGTESSLARSSDLVPYLPGAGVVLRGSAHAMFGIPTPAMAVKLTLHDAERTLLEKTLHVFGERTLTAPTPRALLSMPLVYERAFGGRDVEENPIGVGAGTTGALPNVVDPEDPRRPAGFGPIAPTWASRARLLGGHPAPRLDGGSMNLEDDLDFRWFHAAPEDQQIGFLRGDESIVLVGMRPDAPRFATRLPSARGRARFRSASTSGEIELVADTLFIDADLPTASIVWRGQVALEEALVIHAGVEMPGRSIAWPTETTPPRYEPPPRSTRIDREEEELTGPIVIGDLADILARRAIAPFNLAAPRTPSQGSRVAEIPGAPWSREPASAITADRRPRLSTLPPPAPEPEQELDAGSTFVGLPAPPPRLGPIAAEPSTTAADADPADADDPGRARVVARLERFESLDGVDGEAADLVGIDLSGKSLIGACLRGARLDRANLTGATLAAADLGGASLDGATLRDADLQGADLSHASLAGATLDGAKLARAKLAGIRAALATFDGATGSAVDFGGALLEGASFRGVELPGARFTGAKIARARFDGASLPRAFLVRARGEDVVFDGAMLGGARLARADLPRATFRQANLAGAVLDNAALPEASFEGADLSRASMIRTSCPRASFHGADLSRARLVRFSSEGGDFREASLDLVDARKSQLPEACLADVAMHRARFDRANLRGADLAGADVRGSSFVAAILNDAICSFVRFEGADLKDADLRGTTLPGASIEHAETEGALLPPTPTQS